jgi:hypothetical protein
MELPANLPQRLHQLTVGHYNAIWDYRPPVGHTIEHLLDPDYWVHSLHSGQIRPNDEIRAIAEDRSYYVQLFVKDVDKARQWAQMVLLVTHWQGAPASADADAEYPGGYRIQFSGPHKWRIMSPAGAIVDKGFESKGDAEKALAGLTKARAA